MDRLEFSSAPWALVGLIMLGVVMMAGSAALAVPLLPNIQPGSFAQLVGWVGFIFFGANVLVAISRLVSTRGPIVTLCPEGIRDTRVAADFIPWHAVRNISTWQVSGQKFMVLDVDPEVESRLTLTRTARWSRGINRLVGADGLCVTAKGLNVTYGNLMAHTITYAERFRDCAPTKRKRRSQRDEK